MSAFLDSLRQSIESEKLVGVATVVSGPFFGEKVLLDADGKTEGEISSSALFEAIVARGRKLLEAQDTVLFEVDADGETAEIFFESHAPPDTLVVVGAVHVAIPLVSIARTLGFRTVVVDARSVYATEERFSQVDELIVQWPADALQKMRLHESTYCVFLTHDPKLDNPALAIALRSQTRYVGALGSKRTHALRVAALEEIGLSSAEIARIHAPIGIRLGGNRPEEIALSIAAEIVSVRSGEA